LLGLIYILVDRGESELALKVFAINAGIIIFAFTISKIERSIFNSSRKYRPNNRRHHSNNKERSKD
jgi:hypothetical protein